jgi:hypothetical protein
MVFSEYFQATSTKSLLYGCTLRKLFTKIFRGCNVVSYLVLWSPCGGDALVDGQTHGSDLEDTKVHKDHQEKIDKRIISELGRITRRVSANIHLIL